LNLGSNPQHQQVLNNWRHRDDAKHKLCFGAIINITLLDLEENPLPPLGFQNSYFPENLRRALFLKYSMTITVADRIFPNSRLETPQEYIALAFLVFQFLVLVYVFIELVRGRILDLKKSIGKYFLSLISLLMVWQLLCYSLLYIDCPKVVSLLYALVAAILQTATVMALLDILKGFIKNSKFISTKSIKFSQIGFSIFHLVLIVPHYYLLRFWNVPNNVPNPFSISIFQNMYQLHSAVLFMYICWQFFYMIYYLKAVYGLSDSGPKNSNEKNDPLRKSLFIIITGLSLEVVSMVVWVYSFSLIGLDGILVGYVASTYNGTIVITTVLLFAEIKKSNIKFKNRKGQSIGFKSKIPEDVKLTTANVKSIQ
jgi:hypothetical protein